MSTPNTTAPLTFLTDLTRQVHNQANIPPETQNQENQTPVRVRFIDRTNTMSPAERERQQALEEERRERQLELERQQKKRETEELQDIETETSPTRPSSSLSLSTTSSPKSAEQIAADKLVKDKRRALLRRL